MPGRPILAEHKAEIALMWLSTAETQEIARQFGVSSSAICRFAKKCGWPHRVSGGSKGKVRLAPQVVEVKPKPEKPPKPLPDAVDAELIETRGVWAKLEKVRQARGWTITQVQQRYHRERAKVPVMAVMS